MGKGHSLGDVVTRENGLEKGQCRDTLGTRQQSGRQLFLAGVPMEPQALTSLASVS